MTSLTDAGGPGSAVVYVATELGFTLNPCMGTSADYGADHMFCTSDDPKGLCEKSDMTGSMTACSTNADCPNAGETCVHRAVLPQVLTTGTATSTVFNANQVEGTDSGPFSASGTALSCSNIGNGNISGGALAGAFPDINAPVVQDIVVTDVQVAQ